LSERCNEVLAELEAFVDGELPSEKVGEFVEHLQECPPCLHRADFQAKVKEIFRKKCQSGGSAPPDALVIRVRQTIRAELRYTDEA
jgi:anti-sigma factor (TIGR02949 family)